VATGLQGNFFNAARCGEGWWGMSIREKLELQFDPSDSDRAMRLAYKILTLMRRVQGAIETDNNNLLMGRDQKGDLSSSILEIATQLGLLSTWASGAEIEQFRNELMACPAQPPAADYGEEANGREA
jgi:hypothetical protein